MDKYEPHGKPIPVETVWGDPAALEKAAVAVPTQPLCRDTQVHCCWRIGGRCSLTIACPIQPGGGSAVG